MHILVTGGAGFLGSNLCRTLLRTGNRVTAFDNFSTGSPENVGDLLGDPKFDLIEGDVTQPLPKLSVGGIFNMASPASPIHYQRDPVGTLITNVLGSRNVLDLGISNNARILQASTSEIYGDPQAHPQSERYWGHVNPTGPRACYDEGKRAAETLFMDYSRFYNADIRIARIFNTFGPGMALEDGRVVSNFIVRALQEKPIEIYGTGTQTRSFCYVSDLVEGLIALFFKAGLHVPINIGNPQPISILKLANEILEITKSKSEILFQELPTDDPQDREPDIALARNELGWFPKIDRRFGLAKTVEYFQIQIAKTEFNPH
jgi:UDP-glucuronate decarboxylase